MYNYDAVECTSIFKEGQVVPNISYFTKKGENDHDILYITHPFHKENNNIITTESVNNRYTEHDYQCKITLHEILVYFDKNFPGKNLHIKSFSCLEYSDQIIDKAHCIHGTNPDKIKNIKKDFGVELRIIEKIGAKYLETPLFLKICLHIYITNFIIVIKNIYSFKILINYIPLIP